MNDLTDISVVSVLAFGFAALVIAGGFVILYRTISQKREMKEELWQRIRENDFRKQMLGAALESQEDERKKISKNLHDDVGMMLMTMRVSLSNMQNSEAKDLKELVDATHERIKRISWDLMPPTLEHFGLTNSLKEMCSKLTGKDGTSVIFAETGLPGRLDKNQEVLLYRIAQEAVNNAIRHAGGSHILVKMAWLSGHLDLSVSDNGRGFDFSPVQHGFSGRHGLGIYNLENRAQLLGGKLEYKKNLPTGTILSVRLQLNANELD
ncbi:MAG: sensor histidine kinase [Cyclobacteriaceae bacterium]